MSRRNLACGFLTVGILLVYVDVSALVIEGTVKNDAGEPVSGAVVVVTDESDRSAQSMCATGEDGSYSMSFEVWVAKEKLINFNLQTHGDNHEGVRLSAV